MFRNATRRRLMRVLLPAMLLAVASMTSHTLWLLHHPSQIRWAKYVDAASDTTIVDVGQSRGFTFLEESMDISPEVIRKRQPALPSIVIPHSIKRILDQEILLFTQRKGYKPTSAGIELRGWPWSWVYHTWVDTQFNRSGAVEIDSQYFGTWVDRTSLAGLVIPFRLRVFNTLLLAAGWTVLWAVVICIISRARRYFRTRVF